MFKRKTRIITAVTLTLGPFSIAGTAAGMPNFGDWSDPIHVHSPAGPSGPLNTPAVDGCVSISRDGLELYFTSNRTGKFEVYVARRSSTDSAFDAPLRLPDTINALGGACPTIVGRNTLYFGRIDGGDAGNIYVSHRSSGDWGTATPVAFMNSPRLDETVAAYEDDQGREVLMWTSRDPSGANGVILQSVAGGQPEPVPGSPNESGSNSRASITHDGLTIYFDSTRAGGLGGPDLWYATRNSTSEPFGPAYHLSNLSSPGFDGRPVIAWDGTQLFFSSNRAGSISPAPDIWMAERRKSRGPKTIEFPSGGE